MSNATTVVKATAFWAQLDQTNQFSNKYQIDISNLSAAAVEALQERGIQVKNKGDERGFFVTCKSKFPIEARNAAGDSLAGVKIGNGSTITAVLNPYEWKSPQGMKGVSANLKQLVVNDLVSYEKDGDAEPINFDEAL